MKKALLTALCLCLLLGLCACGGEKAEQKPADFELSACAEELLASDAFTDLLSAVPAETGALLYGVDGDDVSDASVYCSTGATAEEIAIFKASDEDAAARIKSAAEARVEAQKDSYESYVPAEVPKLEKAIVRVNGLYVVLVVADDADAAGKILDDYM